MIFAGIDIGGTNVKFAVVSRSGKVLFQNKERTFSNGKDFGAFSEALALSVRSLRKRFKAEKMPIGVGIAGDVDSERGVLRFSPNLSGWRNAEIRKKIEPAAASRCWVQNDANMAAWGAYALELKGKKKNGVVITMGTGIGGGIIAGGDIYGGFTSTAGEFGHMKIQPGGRKCNCGERGCLEAYVGSYALVKRAREKIGNARAWAGRFGKKRLSASCLYEAARRGDKTALDLWKETGRYLGLGLSNVIYALNPEFVVIAGGVSRSAEFFMPQVSKVFAAGRIKTPFEKLKIVVSKNADLGVLGAAFYAMKKHGDMG